MSENDDDFHDEDEIVGAFFFGLALGVILGATVVVLAFWFT